MCTDSKCKLSPINSNMEAGFDDDKKGGLFCSKLLEFAATDDLGDFRREVEERGSDIDEASFWYGRCFGLKQKMGYEERTPTMIASLYGSTEVLRYIISTGKVDVKRACGSDGATPLHCAATGGSWPSVEIVRLLIDASADIHVVNVNGRKPGDLIAPCVKSSSGLKRRALEMLLNGTTIDQVEEEDEKEKEGILSEKKEYLIDVSLPDINNGVYGSDEFRMYSFKVKPCSRAYSHDWTECPFVHPGENARRRDLRKYHYTCVPCPDFKKGSCAKGDGCEYAHGVFESWLHPAQYRTRLCKDETCCVRRVCFFAHRPEELRPLYASTGSAMPSPKSMSSLDLTTPFSPLSLGSPSMSILMMGNGLTSPMSPGSSASMWQNNNNNSKGTLMTLPTLQLPGSRLKTGLTAREMELDMESIGLEKIRTWERQQLVEEMASLPSPYGSRMGADLKPTNLDEVFRSLDPSLLSQLQGLSPKLQPSPMGLQIRQNNTNHHNQLRASYPSNTRAAYGGGGFDSSAAVATAVMNSGSSAFAKRSQSFVDRAGPHRSDTSGPIRSAAAQWGSPDGRLEWGFDEASKMRRSSSFGFRTAVGPPQRAEEPDVSWVNTLVRDEKKQGGGGGGEGCVATLA